jgi:hypothetical protein
LQGVPQLLYGCVDSMFEIDEGVFRPQGGSQLLPAYHFAFTIQKEP